MLTIKLVVIGASGVGKTSLRGQYISGQFSTSYRATIGADFISKTLPHPRIPGESVTLQIWDTAGQERFASLASAFYRGADAVLLMFDVNRPETLPALRTWWLDFCVHASLAEEDMGRFCVVVVGNKVDLVGTEQGAPEAVPPACAWEVIRELVPYDCPAANSTITHPAQLSDSEDRADIDTAQVESGGDAAPSESIAIHSQRRISHLRSHSRASSRFDAGTMTSVGTVNTIYHTPASSLSTDIFHSARTSPERSRSLSSPSLFSLSSSDGATITPGMLSTPTNPHPNTNPATNSTINTSGLERGPQLFYTSAKTGAGVGGVFEAVVRRVVGRWACEEAQEAQRLHVRDASAGTGLSVRLDGQWSAQKGKEKGCCA